MAALVEGQQYGLSAQDKINSNKSIVFVKLTDSALRSIEEYVRNKGGADSKPTIQFQNSNGILSLPQNGANQTYGFSLSNVEADGPQGSFECLRQIGHRSLDSVGCMHMKMHIHANEESYENTRVKMAAVEFEKNKSCTKVIKPAGAHLGRKVKVKRPGLVMNPVKPHSSPPSVSMLNKNPLKPTNCLSNGSSITVPPKKLPEINRFPKITPKNKFISSPELLRQPIRDRIIHILAVRAYKRPELIGRLMTEGIREKDRKGISAILSQVGVLKENVYNLANYCWNEVQDNWKFSTQDELEVIRRRKQQMLNVNAMHDSPSLPPHPSSSPRQKRLPSESFSVGQEPRAKKQRISHYKGTTSYNTGVKNESGDSNDRLHLTTTSMNRKNAYSPNTIGIEQESGFSLKSPSSSCDGYLKKPKLSHGNRADSFTQNGKKESSDVNEKIHFTTTTMNRINSNSPALSLTNGIRQESELSPKSPDNSCDGYSVISQINSDRVEEVLPSSSLNLKNTSKEVEDRITCKYTTEVSQQEERSSEKSFNKGQLPIKRYKIDESSQPHLKSTVNSDLRKSSNNQSLSQAPITDTICERKAQVSPDSNTPYETKELKTDSCLRNGYVNSSIKSNSYSAKQSSYVSRSKVTSTTNGSCSTSPHSPESYSDSNDSMGENSPELVPLNLPPTPDSDSEFPDYVSKYTRIKSHEQRARYKNDFNAQYDEYKDLHSKIETIKKKFIELNQRLQNFEKGSEQFKKISSNIIKEYRAYHQDENYKKSEEKLNYLHNKLSHIKKLVMEYDKDFYVKS